jgi:hypothetical protein
MKEHDKELEKQATRIDWLMLLAFALIIIGGSKWAW